MRLFPFDDPVHQEVAELLPWFVNGTLETLERAKVQRHLAQCIACKQEVVHLTALQADVIRDESDPAIAQALSRVRTRIERFVSRRSPPRPVQTTVEQWRSLRPWHRGVVIGQLIVIVALAALMASRTAPQYYHTLAAPAAPAHASVGVVVIFDGTRSEQEIRDLLLRLRACIVDGPTPEGAYTLVVPAGKDGQQAALIQLRQQRAVAFAEPALQSPTPFP